MGTYIPFTEEQRERARMTDLAAFLERCGETLKRSGSEQMWLDHGQKVTIRGNLWFHQYEQVGGDAIDFARRFYGMAYPEAVQLMLSMGVGTIREPVELFTKKPLQTGRCSSAMSWEPCHPSISYPCFLRAVPGD